MSVRMRVIPGAGVGLQGSRDSLAALLRDNQYASMASCCTPLSPLPCCPPHPHPCPPSNLPALPPPLHPFTSPSLQPFNRPPPFPTPLHLVKVRTRSSPVPALQLVTPLPTALHLSTLPTPTPPALLLTAQPVAKEEELVIEADEDVGDQRGQLRQRPARHRQPGLTHSHTRLQLTAGGVQLQQEHVAGQGATLNKGRGGSGGMLEVYAAGGGGDGGGGGGQVMLVLWASPPVRSRERC